MVTPVKKRFSLVWPVTLKSSPIYSYERRSFPFSVGNAEYYFKINRLPNNSVYEVVLHRVDDGGDGDSPFDVSVGLEKEDGTRVPNTTVSRKTIASTPQSILRVSLDVIAPCNAANVVCHFPWVTPAAVRRDKGTNLTTHSKSTNNLGPDIVKLILESIYKYFFLFVVLVAACPVIFPTATRSFFCRPFHFASCLESLSLDLGNLLKNEILSDVQLRCGDRVVPAHRSVLAARSEVFAAMFSNEMSENRTGTVNIENMDERVFLLFLEYLYSGTISAVPDEVVLGLYVAAHKYAVHALRIECRKRMMGALAEQNCLSFLTVADTHRDADFKRAVISFICSHGTVFESDAWQKFRKSHPSLMAEVYQSFVEYKNNKSK